MLTTWQRSGNSRRIVRLGTRNRRKFNCTRNYIRICHLEWIRSSSRRWYIAVTGVCHVWHLLIIEAAETRPVDSGTTRIGGLRVVVDASTSSIYQLERIKSSIEDFCRCVKDEERPRLKSLLSTPLSTTTTADLFHLTFRQLPHFGLSILVLLLL